MYLYAWLSMHPYHKERTTFKIEVNAIVYVGKYGHAEVNMAIYGYWSDILFLFFER